MNSELRKQILPILDALMSEYGWTLEYCLQLPSDVLLELFEGIGARKRAEMQLWVKLIGAACAAGFCGKLDKLDGLFVQDNVKDDSKETTEKEKLQWKSQLKALWLKLGKNDEEFDRRWAAGENINL